MSQSQRVQKIPGPDHPITMMREEAGARVIFRGIVIAESDDVVTLREAGYPPVFYFPRAGVRMDLLQRSAHKSWCPYKGEASYYSLATPLGGAENAVWSYETPFDAVADIRERLAFYPSRVDSIETL